MKLIDTRDAVGHVLCHDLTQIIRGVTKDARFRKGHVVTEADIPVLLSMGKEHLYVWERQPGMLHEDEAALRLRALCQNEHMHATAVKEGKVELIADCDGLFQVDVARLNALNGEDEKTCGLITTGSEVAKGLIEDTFTPVIVDKLAAYGIKVTEHCLPGDDMAAITAAALDYKAKGVDLVLCTGGMSVDPDDKTPRAIRDTGADIVSYGAPVLPGAMFLLGYCVMYAKATVFDLVLPRIAAGVPVSRTDLKALGHGGLCLSCPECHYPNCPFGKGA